jgi:ABC-type transporter lipoprotein component MlaA
VPVQLESEPFVARVAVYGWNTRRPLRLPIVGPTTETQEAGGTIGRVAA